MYTWKLLKELFGHWCAIASKFVGKITEDPQTKLSNCSGLLEFANQLKKSVDTHLSRLVI